MQGFSRRLLNLGHAPTLRKTSRPLTSSRSTYRHNESRIDVTYMVPKYDDINSCEASTTSLVEVGEHRQALCHETEHIALA